MGGRRGDVGNVEGNGGDEEGQSSTSQHLLPAFLIHFPGGEKVGDGLVGGCCVEGSPGGEGGHSQKVVCVATGRPSATTKELVAATRWC